MPTRRPSTTVASMSIWKSWPSEPSSSRGQADRGRAAIVLGVGLIRAGNRPRWRMSGSVLPESALSLSWSNSDRSMATGSRCGVLDDEVGDELVAAAFLVLLAAGMEVAGVDDRQRRGALAVLAEAFGEQLVVPEADRFEALAPGGKHADRGAAAGFHQPRHADVVEHGVVQRRRGAEPLVHGRRAFEQMLHVEAHHGRRQQADGAEDREPPADAVGNREDVLAAEGVGQIAEPARLAGDGNHAAAELSPCRRRTIFAGRRGRCGRRRPFPACRRSC